MKNEDVQSKVNILLVDDDPTKQQLLESILERRGENLVKAASGREALKCWLKQDFAVILLDVNMPVMDGFETAALIRQQPHSEKTPIIFVTAYRQTDLDALHGYSMGAVDYMFSPLNPRVLKAKVQVFVDLYRMNQAVQRQAEQLAAANQELERRLKDIQRLNLDLEIANRELEAFSYSASHDLMAPLNSIDGFSRLLLEKYQGVLDEQGRDYLSRVRAASQRMGQVIEDLLKLSRLTRAELVKEPLDVGRLATQILGDLQASQPERLVETIVSADLAAEGDPRLLRLALENLLGNAWKFTGKTPQPRIEVGRREQDGQQVFFIQDNGASFEMAEAEQLFIPFHRLHSSSEFSGTGIGLAIVDRVIRRHGGRVWVTAQVNQGACFYFTLA
ncbi:MAG: response regulator [Deltaproteobacteria bacterium]|nr:response regulator [Deltaproteobacteria bacterium]